MKKHTLVSIIISIIVLIVTSGYWLSFESLPVNMDGKGNESRIIEALLNKKNNDEFNRVRIEKIEINSNDNNHTDIDVKRLKSSEKTGLIIINVKKGNKLILKPDSGSIIFTYLENLIVKQSIKFNYKIFIFILILACLLAYNSPNYIRAFKKIQGKSKIETAFLAIFFAFLFMFGTYLWF